MTTKTKTAKVQAKTQTQQKPKGVIYTFGGEYFCRQDKGLGSKAYELTVTFPDFLVNALSTFKKGVSETGHPIRNLMIKKYPDFTSVRTYNVINVVNNTNAKPKKSDDIATMNIEQLKVFIDENELNIDVVVYGDDVAKVREAIKLAQDDPEEFEKIYAEAVKEYEYKKQLEELNQDGDDNGDSKSDEDENSKKGEGESDVDDLLDDLDGDDNGENE